jgi:hypothetical protein
MSLGTRLGADFDSAAPPCGRASSGLVVSCASAAAEKIAGAPAETAHSKTAKAHRETRIVASRYQPNLASRHQRRNKQYLCYFDRKTLLLAVPRVTPPGDLAHVLSPPANAS